MQQDKISIANIMELISNPDNCDRCFKKIYHRKALLKPSGEVRRIREPTYKIIEGHKICFECCKELKIADS